MVLYSYIQTIFAWSQCTSHFRICQKKRVRQAALRAPSQHRGLTKMYDTQVIIQRVRSVNAQVQHVELALPAVLAEMLPGQTLLVRTGSGWDPYLREQWWPVQFSGASALVERPATSVYEPGQTLDVLGPVGEPYRFRRTLRNVLLAAYDTPPTALLPMIPLLLDNQTGVTVILLGSAADYSTTHLPPEVEVVRGGADLNWPDRVMTVGLADQVFAVVHPDDENGRFKQLWDMFQSVRADIPKNYLFGVYRPPLPCGTGACQACMIRLQQGAVALACKDGPALDLAQVKFP